MYIVCDNIGYNANTVGVLSGYVKCDEEGIRENKLIISDYFIIYGQLILFL